MFIAVMALIAVYLLGSRGEVDRLWMNVRITLVGRPDWTQLVLSASNRAQNLSGLRGSFRWVC